MAKNPFDAIINAPKRPAQIPMWAWGISLWLCNSGLLSLWLDQWDALWVSAVGVVNLFGIARIVKS